MGQQVGYFGRTTQPDVESIIKAVPVEKMQPGFFIEYLIVEGLIKEPVGSSRFRTVTNAWRKKLWNENKILVGVVPKLGFQVMNNEQRVSHSSRKLTSGLRGIGRGVRVAESTPDENLTEESKRKRTHIIHLGGMLRTTAAVEGRKYVYKIPVVADSETAN